MAQLTANAPWSTGDCADYLGFTREWVRVAIDEGVLVDGRRVRLAAETVTTGSRRIYRIHLDQFCEFLSAIGWQRLPARPDLCSSN
jgi:hypothetical protein